MSFKEEWRSLLIFTDFKSFNNLFICIIFENFEIFENYEPTLKISQIHFAIYISIWIKKFFQTITVQKL